MITKIDICGILIPFSEITEFQLVQKEYIYRPVYIEKQKSFFSSKKYEFAKMIPYAAIIDESGFSSSVSKTIVNPFSAVDAFAKDIYTGVVGVMHKAGEILNIKDITKKQYKCRNIAGREFTTFLEDIPASAVGKDGKISDIYKNDELYRTLGEPIAPTILTVSALYIAAKNRYIFYGNGIQLNDAENVYSMLRDSLHTYRNSDTSTLRIGSLSVPNILKLPSVNIERIKEPSEILCIESVKDEYSNI